MGKEWLYWGGSGTSSNNNNSNNSSRSTKRGKKAEKEGAHTASGCMSAFFHLLDLHPLNLALNHQQEHPTFKPESFLPEEFTVLKGVEAPRNSLDLEDALREAASLPPLATKKDNNADLNIKMGIQVKTSVDKIPTNNGSRFPRPTDDLSSESSSSPSNNTPNLVARLMGLDVLPAGSCSPSLSSTSISISKSQHYSQLECLKQELRSRRLLHAESSNKRYSFDGGSRSLPETPRISLGRKSDVDHRLSLQINKENIGEELDLSSYNKLARRRDSRLQDESKSPGRYARQIVKQVKGVSSRVGLDLTNTIKNKEQQRRDDNVVPLKAKKPSKCSMVLTSDELGSRSQTTASPSCSPRLRFLETTNNQFGSSASKNQNSQSPKVSSLPERAMVSAKPKSQVTLQKPQPHQHHKRNKLTSERYGARLKKSPQASDAIRNKQGEPFVRASTTNKANVNSDKKPELSCELLHITVPTLLPVKKDPKLSQKQAPAASDVLTSKSSTQLSSSSDQSYKQQQETHTLTTRENSKSDNNIHNNRCCNCNGANTTTSSSGDGEEYYQYITRILKRTGIDKNTPVTSSYAKWYSSAHPLDPSIFHHLELLFYATTKHSELSPKCNRKLLFQLVDELLVEILKPIINLKPWVDIGLDFKLNGSELVQKLCNKIESLPHADCRDLEDIDALIDKDISRRQFWGGSIAYEEEGEGIVAEIERDIVDTLVHETAILVFVFGLA